MGDALKAAMAEPGPSGYGVGPTSSQLPGGVAGAAPAGASPATGAMQTPEEASGQVVMARQTYIFRGFLWEITGFLW